MSKLIICLLGMFLISTAPTHAENKLFPCRPEKDGEALLCELRLENKSDFRSASIVDGDKSVGVELTLFEKLKPSASMYFLIDSGKMIDAASFNRMKSIINRSMKSTSTSYAVYKFARKLEAIAPIGTPPETIRLALNSVSQGSDLTEGLAALNALLALLDNDKSEKKTIVLLSDGAFSDSAYQVKEISDKLRNINVSVLSVSPRNSSEALTLAQPIRRLSIETDGEFFTVLANQTSIDQVVSKISSYNENGGILSFNPIAKTAKLNVELVSGTLSIEVNAPETWRPRSVEKTPEPILPWYQIYFNDLRSDPLKMAVVIGGGAILLLLLIGTIFALSRRKKLPDMALSGSLPVRQSPVGYFEFLDGNGSTLPIFAGTVRIGRHESNDVVLQNTSVHRQHAVISRSNSGAFTIMDLNTENGVVVNGEKVTRADLQDHDLIELGEVRLRFRKA